MGDKVMPSVGVTGIVTDDDVAVIAECVKLLPPTHRLMAGVLVSAKTLRGEATANRRYPLIGRVEELLSGLAAVGAWPVVHFNCREGLREHVAAMVRAFPSMRGLQLNVVRPDRVAIGGLRRDRPEVEFILQVNRGSASAGEAMTAASVAAYVDGYADVAAHVLLDASGGEGRPLSPELAAEVLDGWRWACVPSLAGGLGPDASPILYDLASRVRNRRRLAWCSVDAESKLRVPVDGADMDVPYQDRLAARKAVAWVRRAAEFFGWLRGGDE